MNVTLDEPCGESPTPEYVIRLRLALNRLYWRAAEWGQSIRSQADVIIGEEEPPGSWQGTQAAGKEVMNYGHSTNK